MTKPVLQVEDLRVYYHTDAGPVKAVDGVSFSLGVAERLGLVGESGCGKSTLALTLMRLLRPPGRIEGGRILLDGVDLAALSREEMRHVRLKQISLIPQGAMNSLNPVMRVCDQIIDGMGAHNRDVPCKVLEERAEEALRLVGLAPHVASMYPHELSGGMKQRVCTAIAISLRPKVIIADEPTSALDVVVQRQVMMTIRRLQQELGASVILIGHDMGLTAQFAERLAVMYAGRLVEIGHVREMFQAPLHPYTRLLISSVPLLAEKGVFRGIPGLTPSLLDLPQGCNFHPRCPDADAECRESIPEMVPVGNGRWVACHKREVER